MAFVSMFFVFILICIGILVLMFLLGSILLIIGLIKKKKYENQGKKAPKLLIISGSILLGIPILIVGVIFITGISSEIKTRIQRKGYDSCIDKWKHEWVSDHAASDEALEWIIDAAEKQDKEAIMSVFTEEIQDDEKLSQQIDAFLEDYPGGFAEIEFDQKGGSSPGSVRDGKVVNQFYYSYEGVKDGEYYYIEIGGCNQNEEDSDLVGVEYFILKSERAEVYYDDISEDGHTYSEYILADVHVNGDFETRRIWGYPWKYYDYDRTITKEEMIQAFRSYERLADIEERLGKPNGVNLALREVVYEIESEDGNPRYAILTYDYYKHIVGGLQLAGETQENSEWID